MAVDKKRITIEEATKLYPDEWVVFSEPRENQEDTTFIDGVVFFHDRDLDLVLSKAEEITGPVELVYTGEPKYRNVTFGPLDAIHKPAA